jgi:hypothetical protein
VGKNLLNEYDYEIKLFAVEYCSSLTRLEICECVLNDVGPPAQNGQFYCKKRSAPSSKHPKGLHPAIKCSVVP